MNLIPYNYFVYINYLLSGLNILLPWILDSSASLPAKLSFSLIGLATLIISLLSSEKDFPKINLISKKLVLLGIFVFSILQTFTPYLVSFTDRSNLVWLALAIPAITLVAIFFTNFEEKDS